MDDTTLTLLVQTQNDLSSATLHQLAVLNSAAEYANVELRFILVGIGIVWGVVLWRLTILAKNQRQL